MDKVIAFIAIVGTLLCLLFYFAAQESRAGREKAELCRSRGGVWISGSTGPSFCARKSMVIEVNQ
ncbi:hypothetical protein HOU00_gp155 [Caulobacter phage CcrPW]|uniref:Uncharacterized protein n=1 Tax=Caulobacter phage CcrPW TaxID=2283271 RepID=A0A385EBE4_9CAUD|nr:hypothetical protein HOU00_gp155 [Caulobacter phage CcrPW]AXQ68970.1 hypothetical protein CcrPW_gp431c [Caulobacter phage CcrPW]